MPAKTAKRGRSLPLYNALSLRHKLRIFLFTNYYYYSRQLCRRHKKTDFPLRVPACPTFARCVWDPSRPWTPTSSASCAWDSPMRKQHSPGQAARTTRNSQCECLGLGEASPSMIPLCNVPLPPASRWWDGHIWAIAQGQGATPTPALQCVSLKSLRPAPGVSEIIPFGTAGDDDLEPTVKHPKCSHEVPLVVAGDYEQQQLLTLDAQTRHC